MKQGFRQSMNWLHTWSGLLVGWVLYFIFVTGTAGYFDTEIDRWMQPERPLVAPIGLARALDIGLARLESQAPHAQSWTIYPPGMHSDPEIKLQWREAVEGGRGRSTRELIDGNGAAIKTRETGGGQLLYQMHYRLHYLPAKTAYWIVGACAMFMLVAIVSGVITHKRIFKDFFTFRPAKGQRSWLDAHNAVSVVALPFHLMITYSGLVFYMFTYMPLIVASAYGVDEAGQQAFYDLVYRDLPGIEKTGVAGQRVSLHGVVAAAQRYWGQADILSVSVREPGDSNAQVVVSRRRSNPQSGADQLVFSGRDGTLLRTAGPVRFAPRQANDVLIGLHEGLFAGPLLRWLYFLAGLTGTVMIATGLVLWARKRAERRTDGESAHGLGLVQRLNVGTIVGLPLGIAAFFWANRLLPVDLPYRAAWEAHALFAVWAAALVYGFMRPAGEAWIKLCAISAMAFVALPLLNALTTKRHLGVTWPHALATGDWALAAFDLCMIAFGLVFAGLSWRLRSACLQESQSRAPHATLKFTAAAKKAQ